jgi:hypothetical protein
LVTIEPVFEFALVHPFLVTTEPVFDFVLVHLFLVTIEPVFDFVLVHLFLVTIEPVFGTVKMPRPVISTNSIGLSSIMDRESTNDMVPMQKHQSIYRPLSETESEDGSNLVIFVNDEHDDFIPDAEGNIHMNSGQIIT